MFTTIAIVATVSIAAVVRLHSKAGRRYIGRMFYEGRHNVKPTRAERQWVGTPEPRVVYTNLDSQRMIYPAPMTQWN